MKASGWPLAEFLGLIEFLGHCSKLFCLFMDLRLFLRPHFRGFVIKISMLIIFNAATKMRY